MTTMDELLDTLSEARRYARTSPQETHRLLTDAIDLMLIQVERKLFKRLKRNLMAGLHFITVDPDVIKGYITGAMLELQDEFARQLS